jgi:hypothetical protein
MPKKKSKRKLKTEQVLKVQQTDTTPPKPAA